MVDYLSIERQLTLSLALRRRPVAVKFRDVPLAGVAKFTGTEPSGCSFWRLAAEGRTFYTVPSDHYNCPVGAHTHNISLPQDRSQELTQVLSLMTSIGYLKIEEVPSIARLPQTPGVVIYSPLGDAPLDPDVVVFAGKPARLMLLQEAAVRVGSAAQAPLLGRPTCMALPAAMTSGTVMSTGCIGNRVYTDLAEDELYVAVRGKDLAHIAQELETIADANSKLLEYHRTRRQQLATL
ncbi:MAG TPA: DUF169 domain-containing protein [Candidatus Limnocylindria bacterium]|nr:DUF169 domain-containing protein [Candidatus Limnocylindria bacterium]